MTRNHLRLLTPEPAASPVIPLFPGSDPMGDSFYAAVAADFRALGFGSREFAVAFAGLPDRILSRLEAAFTAAGVLEAMPRSRHLRLVRSGVS